MHSHPTNQSQQAQITDMLLHHLTDNQLTHKDKLTSLSMANLTTVLDNQTILLGSNFIKIKGNNLLKVTQQLLCKELLFKVSLTINISNLNNTDYYQVNLQVIIIFRFFDLTL